MAGLVLPRNFFYAAIIFALMITGIVALIGETEKDVPGGPEINLMDDERITEFNRTFYPKQLADDIENLSGKMKALQPSQQWGALDVITLPLAFIGTAWDMVKFVIGSFGFMNTAIEGLSTYSGLPIPSWVPIFIILLITVLFIFSILTIIFGKET